MMIGRSRKVKVKSEKLEGHKQRSENRENFILLVLNMKEGAVS